MVLKAIKPWLNFSVDIITGSKDAYGSYTYDPFEKNTVNCYVSEEQKIIRSFDGEEVLSKIHLYFEPDININSFDKIIYDNKEYKIQGKEKYYDAGLKSWSIQVVHL